MRSLLFPGDRRVWTVAGVLGALISAVILFEVLLPRDYYTGTNSVRTRSIVTDLAARERLCIHDLHVPSGTGVIELDRGASGPRPPLVAHLYIHGQRLVSRLDARPVAPRKLAFPFGLGHISAPSATARLCLELQGRGHLSIGGMLGLSSQQVPPTVDGKRQQFRVGVWYRPATGERESLVSLWPAVARRAALFRPTLFHAEFYWLLLLGVIPLLAYSAIRLLANAFAGRAMPRTVLVVLAALAFTNAAIWAVVTPAFDAPDEYDHYAYAEYLAQTGRAPCQACSRQPWSTEQTITVAALRTVSYIETADGRPPWLSLDEVRWKDELAGLDPPARRDDGGGVTTAATHSPLYYGMTVPAYAASFRGSVVSRLTAMRLVSALLGAITAVFVLLTARELLSRQSQAFALAAGLLIAFQPMFAFGSGSVNNDAGVNAAAAVLIYLLVRAIVRGLTFRVASAIGAALAIAPLMKGTGYALYPAAVVGVVAILAHNHRRRELIAAGTAVVTLGVMQLAWVSISPYFSRTAFTTPTGTAPGSAGPVAEAISNPLGFGSYLWQVFLPKLPFMADLHRQPWPAFDIYVERGWAAFGWYAIGFPHWVYVGILAAMLSSAALGILTLRRMRQSKRILFLPAAVLGLVILCVVGGVEASYYSTAGDRAVVAEQGRYVFTAIGPLAILVVGSCFAFGRKTAVWLASSLVVLMLGLSVASQLLAFQSFYT